MSSITEELGETFSDTRGSKLEYYFVINIPTVVVTSFTVDSFEIAILVKRFYKNWHSFCSSMTKEMRQTSALILLTL